MTTATETGTHSAGSGQAEATFEQLCLDMVRTNKTNPRRTLDPEKMKELTASVKEKGILEPLLVRGILEPLLVRPVGNWKINDGDKDGHRFEVVAGERRFLAAKGAGLKYIPCLVRAMTDEEALEIQVIENLQREDLHPLDEGLGYKKLLASAKYDVAGLATKVGKSARYVYQRMQLAALIGPAQKEFLDGRLTSSHAALICRLLPNQQKEALRFCFNDWNGSTLSVRGLQEEIQRHFYLDLSKAPWDLKDAALLPKAGACSTCPKRAENNPQLFEGLTEGDTCTDPDCFEAKGKALVQLMREKHPEAVPVSLSYLYGGNQKKLPKETLPENEFRTGKSCQYSKPAVVVRASDSKPEMLGKVIRICTNRRCRMHYQSYESRSSKNLTGEERKTRERQKQKQEIELRWRRLLLATVLAKIEKAKTLTDADLQVVAHTLVYSCYPRDEDWKVLGLKESEVGRLTGSRLRRALLGLSLSETIQPGSKAADLLSVAKRYGVKVAPFKKQAAAEIQAEAAAEVKAKSAAKLHTSAKPKAKATAAKK